MVEAAFVTRFPIPPLYTLPYISYIYCGTMEQCTVSVINIATTHVLKYVLHVLMKDTVTSLLKWVAPICCIASAVPEYSHFPSSSLSHPTVSWTPGMSYGDKVQRSS